MSYLDEKENAGLTAMGLTPENDPTHCHSCKRPRVICICPKGSGDKKDELGQAGSEKLGIVEMSMIEKLLKRAHGMNLDPQKLFKQEGINLELKDNMEELKRLAQKGDAKAQQLFNLADENVKGRSKLASLHLDSIKNPFRKKQTKN